MPGDDEKFRSLVPSLEKFLRAWERDTEDGITLRGVQGQVRGLRGDFDQFRVKTRDRLTKLETRNEMEDKQAQTDAIREGSGDTGRFTAQPGQPIIAIQTPVQAIPSPFAPGMPFAGQWPQLPAPPPMLPPPPERASQAHIVIETQSRESHFFTSVWKKFKKYASHTIAVALALGLAAIIQWLAGHGCGAAAKMQQQLDKPAASAASAR